MTKDDMLWLFFRGIDVAHGYSIFGRSIGWKVGEFHQGTEKSTCFHENTLIGSNCQEAIISMPSTNHFLAFSTSDDLIYWRANQRSTHTGNDFLQFPIVIDIRMPLRIDIQIVYCFCVRFVLTANTTSRFNKVENVFLPFIRISIFVLEIHLEFCLHCQSRDRFHIQTNTHPHRKNQRRTSKQQISQ